MKIWLSYRFRGADLAALRLQLNEITALLEKKGYRVFTMIKDIQNWDANAMPKAEAVRKAYDMCKKCDAALCIYSTLEASEGRGWDAGYFAGMNKPTIMAIHKSVSSEYTEALYTENTANKIHKLPGVIRYETFQDIANALP